MTTRKPNPSELDSPPRISDPDLAADPYPAMKEARRTGVHHDDVGGGWWATRYADVDGLLRSGCLKDPARATDGSYTQNLMHMRGSLVFMDPPDHTRLRAFVTKAFTQRTVDALRPSIQRIVDDLIAPLIGTAGFDLMTAFARPLPSILIAEMIGVEPADRHQFQRWSDAVAQGFAPSLAPAVKAQILDSWSAFGTYFARVIAERRDAPRDDLITRLIAATHDGDLLSDREMIGLLIEIIDAGTVTTSDLIGNGMLALLTHPAELQKLREHPDLLPNAVNEMLRFDASIVWTERVAIEDTTVAGCPVPAGDWIWPVIGSANHDPSVFPDPERFDIARANADRHLSFGCGRHFCPGAALARLQAQIAIGTLLDTFPTLRLDGNPARKPAPGFSGRASISLRTG